MWIPVQQLVFVIFQTLFQKFSQNDLKGIETPNVGWPNASPIQTTWNNFPLTEAISLSLTQDFARVTRQCFHLSAPLALWMKCCPPLS